jgi:thioredoxin 2
MGNAMTGPRVDTKTVSGSLRLTCLGCGQANRVPADRIGAQPKCGVCGAPLVSAGVAAIDPQIHDRAVRADDLPLLVDYWAPWCGPCRMMAPEFARAAQAMAGQVRFAKINTQDHPQVGERLGIKGIPLLILWRGGQEAARLPGARPAAGIVDFLRARPA